MDVILKQTDNLFVSFPVKEQKSCVGTDICDNSEKCVLPPPCDLPLLKSTREKNMLFDQLKVESDKLRMKNQVTQSAPIKISLPDGNITEGKSWFTTPLEVAQNISEDLAENSIVAKVNHVIWELDRPLEAHCTIQFLDFDDKEAQAVFWHSSAHMLREGMERVYRGCFCEQSSLNDGFCCDMFMDDRQVSEKQDFPLLEQIMRIIVKEKRLFESLETTKENLLKIFASNPYKVSFIEKMNSPRGTVCRLGSFIDLCSKPHLKHTGMIKAFRLYEKSAKNWDDKFYNEPLQIIYGISFPDVKRMEQWQRLREENKKRDHEKIGLEQELFFFHESSPGSCFFLPKGAFIYNTLIGFIKEEYRKRGGYQEVITPDIYKYDIWELWDPRKRFVHRVFGFDIEEERYALKNMNCPGHCLMFSEKPRSWRELPIRYADFGVLHRKELPGALRGLARLRRFQEDDAHIFAQLSQVKQEICYSLNFFKEIYTTFGFTYEIFLSTRPSEFLGDIETWDVAEKTLEECLEEFGHPWMWNPGDGARYGPKIDIQIMDSMQRSHQCATIQVDFQFPVKFDLSYDTKGGSKDRPVIIHRALLGSVERMIAVLTECYGGKWPLWLSPRQVRVLPESSRFDFYGEAVRSRVHEAGLEVDLVSGSGVTLQARLKAAQKEECNFMLVVGETEENHETVQVYTRNEKVYGEYDVQELIERLKYFIRIRHSNAEDDLDVEELPIIKH